MGPEHFDRRYQHITSKRAGTMTLAVGAEGEGDVHFSRAVRRMGRLPVLFVYGTLMKLLRQGDVRGLRGSNGTGNRTCLKSATLGREKRLVNTLTTISNHTLTRR